jgi:hypothetical protein
MVCRGEEGEVELGEVEGGNNVSCSVDRYRLYSVRNGLLQIVCFVLSTYPSVCAVTLLRDFDIVGVDVRHQCGFIRQNFLPTFTLGIDQLQVVSAGSRIKHSDFTTEYHSANQPLLGHLASGESFQQFAPSNAVTPLHKNVPVTPTISLRRPLDPHSSPLPFQLRLTSIRAPQCARNRSSLLSRSPPQPAHSLP